MFDLKGFLKDKKIKQNDFADIIGKSQSSISYVVGGKMDIPEDWPTIIRSKFPDTDLSLYEIEDQHIMAEEPATPYHVINSTNSALMRIIEDQATTIRELTRINAILVERMANKY